MISKGIFFCLTCVYYVLNSVDSDQIGSTLLFMMKLFALDLQCFSYSSPSPPHLFNPLSAKKKCI